MTDARILRTRLALHEAIIKLATQKPVGEITVSELAEQASINRVTFYKHYITPAEALAAALHDELEELHADAPDPSQGIDAFAVNINISLDHIESRRDLYNIAFKDGLDGTIPMMMSRFLSELASSYLTKRRKRKPACPDVDLDVAAAYFAAGTVGAMSVWILEGDMSRERFFENIKNLLPAWFFAEPTTD